MRRPAGQLQGKGDKPPMGLFSVQLQRTLHGISAARNMQPGEAYIVVLVKQFVWIMISSCLVPSLVTARICALLSHQGTPARNDRNAGSNAAQGSANHSPCVYALRDLCNRAATCL